MSFSRIRKSLLEKDSEDVVVIVDISKELAPATNKKLFLQTQTISRMIKGGKVKGGAVITDVPNVEFVSGEGHEDRVGGTYLIALDRREGSEKAIKGVYEGLNKVFGRSKSTKVVVTGREMAPIRRLLEYTARRRDMKITVQMEETGAEVGAARPRLVEGPESRLLVVREEGKKFSDLFRKIKENVKKEEVQDVLAIRKGRREELIIRVKGDGTRAASLRKTIEENVEGLKVAEGKRDKPATYHIKDLEADIAPEDIVKGIGAAAGREVEAAVLNLRPAFGNTQNATVRMPSDVGKKLEALGRIRIGWVLCRIARRTDEVRCFRCFESGHLAAHCKGVDRSKNCFKCGEPGHTKAECKEVVKCLGCGEKGHMRVKCPVNARTY